MAFALSNAALGHYIIGLAHQITCVILFFLPACFKLEADIDATFHSLACNSPNPLQHAKHHKRDSLHTPQPSPRAPAVSRARSRHMLLTSGSHQSENFAAWKNSCSEREGRSEPPNHGYISHHFPKQILGLGWVFDTRLTYPCSSLNGSLLGCLPVLVTTIWF